MEQFLERLNLPKLTLGKKKKETNMKRSVSIKETE